MPRIATYRYQTIVGFPNKWRGLDGSIDYDRVLKSNNRLIKFILHKFWLPTSNEDPAIQDTYLECELAICRAAESWDPNVSKWTTWVYKAVWNACCNKLAESKQLKNRKKLYLSDLSNFSNMFVGKVGVPSEYENNEFINWCLSIIMPKDRDILKLRFLEGFTLKQISKSVGLTSERIRQRINSSIEHIRRKLSSSIYSVPNRRRNKMIETIEKPINDVAAIRTPFTHKAFKDYDYYSLLKDGVWSCPECERSFTSIRGVCRHLDMAHNMKAIIQNKPMSSIPKKSSPNGVIDQPIELDAEQIKSKVGNFMTIYCHILESMVSYTSKRYLNQDFAAGIEHALELFNRLSESFPVEFEHYNAVDLNKIEK